MKIRPILILVVLLSSSCYAQKEAELAWLNQYGGIYADLATDLLIDSSQNVYIACAVSSPEIQFEDSIHQFQDSKYADKIYLSNDGRPNEKDLWRVQKNLGQGILLKLDPNGELIWSETLFEDDPNAGNEPYKLCFDQHGNILVTGKYYRYLNETSYEDLTFVKRVDPNGAIKWTYLFNAGQSKGVDIKCDADNNIILAGSFRFARELKLGTTVRHTTNYQKEWSSFIVKMDKNGKGIWIQKFQGNGFENLRGICVDKHGDIYYSLEFTSSNLPMNQQTYTSKGDFNVLIGKLEGTKGTYLWEKQLEGEGMIRSTSIDIGEKGPIIGGYYSSKILSIDATTYTGKGKNDGYLISLNAKNGKLKWFKNIGSPNNEIINDLLFKDQSIWACAVIDSDKLSIDEINLGNNHKNESYLLQFDMSGDFLSYQRPSSMDSFIPSGIGKKSDGDVYISGFYEYPLLSALDSSKKAYYDTDIYVHRLTMQLGETNALVAEPTQKLQDNRTKSLEVYPNPSIDGIFTIKINNEDASKDGKVLIYDLKGNLIMEKYIALQTTIRLSHIAPGSYTLQIHIKNGGFYTEKLIIL